MFFLKKKLVQGDIFFILREKFNLAPYLYIKLTRCAARIKIAKTREILLERHFHCFLNKAVSGTASLF